MKSLRIAFAIIIVAAFTACSGSGKKVFIMASGKITLDENDNKNIKLEPGTTHNEKKFFFRVAGRKH